jgi:uncharacterized membrane protein HdeD (DUF308 family)
MNIRRIIGILILIGGIVLIVVSQYIKARVEEGKTEISSAQKKVNQGNSLFSLSPYSQPVGKKITGSAQKKIDEGNLQVSQYEELAGQLQIGGVVLIIIGIIIIAIPRKSKRR